MTLDMSMQNKIKLDKRKKEIQKWQGMGEEETRLFLSKRHFKSTLLRHFKGIHPDFPFH